MLNWRTVTNSRDAKFMVRGTELSVAIVPDTLHRFQLCEIRTVIRGDEGIEYDREYHVRDAHSVSDAEVRDKVRPRVVAKFASEAEALQFCDNAMNATNATIWG